MTPGPAVPWVGPSLFALGLILGIGVALWIGRLSARSLTDRLRWTEQRLAQAEPALAENQQLRSRLAEEAAQRRADAHKLEWMQQAEEQLSLSFHHLADQLLRQSTTDLAERSEHELRNLVDPLRQQLSGLDDHVRALERERRGAYDGLRRELDLMRSGQDDLRHSTRRLNETLRAPGSRGRWGEIQLRRLVEMAGMVDRVDFSEQPTLPDGKRPDLVIHLPGGRTLPVDAKTPMSSYLQAGEAVDPDVRQGHLDDHLKAIKQRAQELSSKAYWRSLEGSPDFVIMFLPNEGVLAAAFERQGDFLDQCMAQRVLPATPITLLAVMRSIAWGWRQQAVTEDAARIAEIGRELHDRLLKFSAHLGSLGKSLDAAVSSYNRTLGSMERRLLPTVRRLEETTATEQKLPTLQPVDQQSRTPEPNPLDDPWGPIPPPPPSRN